MGWTPSGSRTGANRGPVAAPRFDPWQNRPDRPGRRLRMFGRGRALLVWLAVGAVLMIAYRYHDELAAAGWRILSLLFPG